MRQRGNSRWPRKGHGLSAVIPAQVYPVGEQGERQARRPAAKHVGGVMYAKIGAAESNQQTQRQSSRDDDPAYPGSAGSPRGQERDQDVNRHRIESMSARETLVRGQPDQSPGDIGARPVDH